MQTGPVSTLPSNEVRERLLSIKSFLAVVCAGRPGPLNDVQQSFLEAAYKATTDIEPLIDIIDQMQSDTHNHA